MGEDEDSTVELDIPFDIEAGTDPESSSRRSTGARQPPVRLSDYELYIVTALVIQAVNELLEPTSVTEALSAPNAKQWIKALENEYQELMRTHVWELVYRPYGVEILMNK